MPLTEIQVTLTNIILVLIAVLQVLIVVGFVAFGAFGVWFARQVLTQLSRLVDALAVPRISQTETATTGGTTKIDAPAPPCCDPSPEPSADVKPEPKCKTCKARVKGEPTHSKVIDGKTLLVFKCRRCGKETELTPEEAPIVQPSA